MDEDFTIQKNSHMVTEKEKCNKNIETTYENELVKMKIEKSKE